MWPRNILHSGVRDCNNTPMSLISLQDVTHCFGKIRALQNVSLDVPPGAIGLIGQNGAGKSTLLKILLGLIRPTSGGGTVLGRDIRGSGLALRACSGYMPEAESFVPGVRGVDLVALAGELSGMPRKHALRRAHEVLSYLGLEEARYRKCEQYSVGMKQRLKLATALVHDPDLLLLDEPTAGLDPEGREAMLSLLRSLAGRHGKSLILSTHLLGDIDRVCERVIIIDQGQVLGFGPIGDLRAEYRGRYRLRWSGDGQAFTKALEAKCVSVETNGRPGEVVAEIPESWTTRNLFELSRAHHVTLREVSPEEENLEAVYHRLVETGETS